MYKKQLCAAAAAVLLTAASRPADAEVVRYIGPHPVEPKLHNGMCYIEGPHVHRYKPHKALLYAEVDTRWVFIGDPTEFEASAPKYAYYGHHPAFWTGTVSAEKIDIDRYCYITGPHHHWYAPPPLMKFKSKGGAYWFVGKHPAWYRKRLPRHRAIDRHYVHVHLVRPTVVVKPPKGFVGVVVGPGGVQVGAGVAAPRVDVTVGGTVGLGGRVVVGPGGRVVHRGHRGRIKIKRKRRGRPGHAPAWGYRRKHRKHRKRKGHAPKRKGHRRGGKGKRKW